MDRTDSLKAGMTQTQCGVEHEMAERVARRLLALAQPVRIRILRELAGRGELTVQVLGDAVGATQQNASRHLGLLHREGVVERRQEGRVVWYRLADSTALRLIEEASEYVARDMRSTGRPW